MYNWAIIFLSAGLSFLAFQNQSLLEKLVLRPYWNLKKKNFLPLLTSGFIHANWSHLIFNMFTLFFFGPPIEGALVYWYGAQMGGFLFVIFYISGIIISNIPTFLKERSNPNYASLGASGAVSAILFASILIMPLEQVCLFGLLCIPGFVFGPAFLLYSHYASKDKRTLINHDAHFYGALYGLLFILLLKPSLLDNFYRQVLHYLQTL